VQMPIHLAPGNDPHKAAGGTCREPVFLGALSAHAVGKGQARWVEATRKEAQKQSAGILTLIQLDYRTTGMIRFPWPAKKTTTPIAWKDSGRRRIRVGGVGQRRMFGGGPGRPEDGRDICNANLVESIFRDGNKIASRA